MNPELTYTLPTFQTMSGISDMIAHIMERYFTNDEHVELTDGLCESTIKTIIKNARNIIKDPQNYDARAEIMWAGSLAHNGLLGTGREEDWASHGIEHELSGIYDLTHGAGLSIIFPAWMKYVYKHNINRFVNFAHNVFNIDIDLNDLENVALEGIRELEQFFKNISLPTKLNEVDIPSDRFMEMAKKATEKGPLGNFLKLETKDVINILNLAK